MGSGKYIAVPDDVCFRKAVQCVFLRIYFDTFRFLFGTIQSFCGPMGLRSASTICWRIIRGC
ncbi:conserved hypothetical protein [delta proteobacterium NaphS2]|nr:conserved hypothetical protein [delta proteobacterium NaphS2]